MKTIIAEEGYLTQVTLADEANRVFVKKISGADIEPNEWHEVSQQVKLDWEEQYLNSNSDFLM